MDKPVIDQTSRTQILTPFLLAVWLFSALYMATELRRGWFPHDDGALAQSAERVLLGEVPHRDFDEIYTGGLSYLNALAFRILGTNLASMRYMMYLFFLAWVPSLYYIASQFGAPWVAASFTFLAVAWGVPNYSTAMPSWYNLFFATFGLAALFRFIETTQKKWLFVAGLCGGISFLFKLSGMYYVAGSVLFLLFPKGNGNTPLTRTERWACNGLAIFCVLAYEASVLSLMLRMFHPGSFLYFFFPTLTVGAAVIWHRIRSGTHDGEFMSLLGNLFLFGAGVALPVFIFLIPYARVGAVADFMQGVLFLPGKRLQYTIRAQSLPRFLAGIAADTILLIVVFGAPRKLRALTGGFLVAASLVVAFMARKYPPVYDAIWVPIWNSLPVVILAAILLLLAKASDLRPEKRQRIFLLLAVTAACNLIQFPYSAPIYFCYVAPLLVLCVLAAGTLPEDLPRGALSGLFCVCLLYALFVVTPRFLSNRGELFVPVGGNADFVLPRSGGLLLYGEDARENATLVDVVTRHARGKYIYAGPDCPQVYFLSGFRNPTRTLFDFLDDKAGRTERILSAIHDHDVTLVVINLAPGFSGPLPRDLQEELVREFPEKVLTSNYEVRWKL
jgi:hypothetical protein